MSLRGGVRVYIVVSPPVRGLSVYLPVPVLYIVAFGPW